MKRTLFTLAMVATTICSFAQNEQERSIKMQKFRSNINLQNFH